MIADVRTGRGFGGLQGYLLEGDLPEPGLQDYLLGGADGQFTSERVAWTSVRNLPVEDPHCAAMVMQATAEQNPRVEKPVYHVSLSLPPGEELTREQWDEAVDRVLKGVGLSEHQVLVVAHNDRPHQHVHLMINRVHPRELKAWDNGHDYARFEKEARHLERDLGLREVPGRHYRLPGQERPEREGVATGGERQEARRTGESPWARQVRFKVYEDFRRAESWPDLERRLAGHGLRLRRQGGGLVVTDGKRKVKASRIYRRGSAGWLEKRFGSSYQEYREQRNQLHVAIYRLREIGRERKELQVNIARRGPELAKARATVAEQQRLAQALKEARREFRQVLDSLYGPERAREVRRRLVQMGRAEGWRTAFKTLAEQPQKFADVPLRSRWSPKQRRLQKALVGQVVRTGRRWMVLRAARMAGGPEARRAVATVMRLSGLLSKAHRKLTRLPSEKDLARDVAQRALALGLHSVKLVLAPTPMGVVRAALKTAKLAHSVVRGMAR